MRIDDIIATSAGGFAGVLAANGAPSLGWAGAMGLLAYVANEVRRLSARADRQDDRITRVERAIARRKR